MVQEFVVDTSVLVQAFVADTHTLRAVTLMQTLLAYPPTQLHVTEFGFIECVNIMWKRVVFHGVSEAEMQKALLALVSTRLTIQPTAVLLPRALKIGTTYRLAVYDSLYLALAEKIGCPIITEDARQAAVATQIGLALEPLSNFPEYKI